jgi:Transposase IS66 family
MPPGRRYIVAVSPPRSLISGLACDHGRTPLLGWHHDRGNLVRFLAEPRVEPTNHREERALRPAVIARKVSQCSKHDRGTGAFAVFLSVRMILVNTATAARFIH